MPRLVCSACEVELRCTTSGVGVVVWAEFGPYKLYYADEWTCPSCGHSIVAGFAHDAIAEHYEDLFKKVWDELHETPQKVRHDFESQGQRARFKPKNHDTALPVQYPRGSSVLFKGEDPHA